MTKHFERAPETALATEFEVVFDHYDPEDERRRESLLSLGNGVIHCRASAPEERHGETHYPGFYRAGCYARLSGQVEGQAVATDSLANLPTWLDLSFQLEGGDWLSLDRVTILKYRQRLDLKTAILTREVTFRDAQGRTSAFSEERFVSMAARNVGALRISLHALDWAGRINIRSGICGDVGNALAAEEGGYDPQALEDLHLAEEDGWLIASATTLGTGNKVTVAARTLAPDDATIHRDGASIRQHWTADLPRGGSVVVVKFGAVDALPDAPDFDALRADHVRAWAQLWSRFDIRTEDRTLSRVVALHAFHLLQTLSDTGLPSRGWQEAYHGHIFWDDTLSLPFLSLHLPDAVRAVLVDRHKRLKMAKRRAAERGLSGALFPWRSGIDGSEQTPEFQQNPKTGGWHRDDTRFQFHVGSAIAHNVWRYFLATGDTRFMADYGAEMMAEIARMWASLARPHPEQDGRLTIRGVVGPDEFHTRYPDRQTPGLDDETYTNVMAAATLLRAHRMLTLMGLDHAEAETWLDIAARLHLVTNVDGLFLPFDQYETLAPFDLDAHERDNPGERLDWFIGAQGGDINALQVQKQATFAMLAHLLSLDELTEVLAWMGYPSDKDQLRRTIEADRARTSHDSSLSNLIYAGALARLSPGIAWDIYRDALHPDEKAGHSGTEQGVHLGAMGASIDILQRTCLGIDPAEDVLMIDPAPPRDLAPSYATAPFRAHSVTVALDGSTLTIRVAGTNEGPVPLLVRGTHIRLAPGETHAEEIPR